MNPNPTASYANFAEKGFDFAAFMPASDAEPCRWRVIVAVNRTWVFEYEVPMGHAPLFGPDVEDVAALEDVTDKVVGLLGGDGVVPGDFADKLKQAGITGKILNGE
jgi:hypothetical protein